MIFEEKEQKNKKPSLNIIEKIKTNKKIIKKFYQQKSYADEPKLWQFSAKIADLINKSDSPWNPGWGGGASFKRNKALIKAIGEAIERYCLGYYKEKDLYYDTYKSVENKCLRLEEIISFSRRQLKKKAFINCRWTKTDKFFWIKGYSLFDKKNLYIPAQLVFVPYDFRKEKIIRLPISTGAAAGTNFSEALLRGILEIIERDAFMIHYLSFSFGELINTVNVYLLEEIKKYFHKYRLELYLINLPTEIKIYNFLALIIDKTGIGPAVSAGLKSGLEPLETAIGAIEEGWHTRPWIRDELNNLPNLKKIFSEGKKLKETKKRGLFWSPIKMLKYITPWIKNKRRINFVNFKSLSSNKTSSKLKYILNSLKKEGHKVYFVDITRPEVSKYGFKVLKVIIPTLHPFYLDESYPYLGGGRIYNLPVTIGFKRSQLKEEEINKIPHFFL